MNEKKKLYIVLAIICLFILAIVGFSIIKSVQSKKIFESVQAKFDGQENSLIYIGKTGCPWCELLNPSLEDMKNRYNFDYIYVNTSKISKKYLNKILQMLGITTFGTPYLAVVSNGTVVATQPEYADYDKIFEFLQTNNIIAQDAELLLNYIGIDEYKELIKSKSPEIIVIGQSTCPYCVEGKLILNDIAAETGIVINYLNLTYLTNDDDIQEFQESFDYFTTNEWGTPLTLIVKDGKIVDMLEQLVSKEEFVNFFNKNLFETNGES